MTLAALVELLTQILIVGTVFFCALGLFELLRPSPKIRP